MEVLALVIIYLVIIYYINNQLSYIRKFKRMKLFNGGVSRTLSDIGIKNSYLFKQMLKKGIKDTHPKNELKYIISEFKEQTNGKKRLAVNIPFLRKDGKIIYADVSTNKIVFNGIDCNVGIMIDVTDKSAVNSLPEAIVNFSSEF